MEMKNWIIGITIVAVLIGLAIIAGNSTGLFGLSEKEKIVIGAILPLSGANAAIGEAELAGIQLAIQEENNSQIELVVEDSQGDSTIAVNSVQAILQKNPVAIFSGLTTTTVPIMPILKDKNIILMIEGSIHPGLASQDKYFFKDYADALEWAQTITKAVKEKSGAKTALIVFQTQQGELFSKEVQKEITPVLVETYDQKNTDFKTIAVKIKQSGAESVIFAGLPKSTHLFIKDMEELEIILPTYLINGEWPEVTANGAGAKIAPYTPGFIENNSAEYNAFAEKYKAKFGKEPKIDSAISYDDTKILLGVIKKCGKNTECVQKEIASVKYTGASGSISFDETRNAKRKSILKQWNGTNWIKAE
jgi:branched-chain amino acid transport system substrate-binding protein